MKMAIQRATRYSVRFVLFAFALLVLSLGAAAAVQNPMPRSTPEPPPSPTNAPSNKDERPLTSFEEEIKAKRAIKMAEKDHEENVNRAKEVADIAKDLQTTLKDKTAIDHESEKKIERLEKLTRKIRNEAGGEDEEVEIVNRPSDIGGAVKQIADSAESLSKTVQKTPRQVVSAAVIGNANVLLQLVKLLRAFTRP
jgi:type IV secretory pathway VirJ component